MAATINIEVATDSVKITTVDLCDITRIFTMDAKFFSFTALNNVIFFKFMPPAEEKNQSYPIAQVSVSGVACVSTADLLTKLSTLIIF